MYITILTLFPDMFSGPFAHSILRHARDKNLLEIKLVDIREYGIGGRSTVDDTAYGGGVGMIMRVDVLHEAITKNRKEVAHEKVVLLTASGKPFSQGEAKTFAQLDHLMLICGHYEGIDARITKYIDQEISIGDFVTTGGELPAMLMTDAVARLIPGVLKPEATELESFSLTDSEATAESGSIEAEKLLEYPQYTRPAEYDGQKVPDILVSGDHKKIAEWRLNEAKNKTRLVRPDLISSD
jgi:tRNA (guanine37-N1)-methyltransferase